jgi:hypothetical protein
MELDEFKEMWSRFGEQASPTNDNITEMIYRDSQGPLATFEKNTKFTLFIFPLVAVLFGGVLLSQPQHSPTMWLLFAILFIEFLFAVFNYGIVKKIGQPQGNVKHDLLRKIAILQNSYRLYLLLNQILYLLMAILLEIGIYYHFDSNFDSWSKINPLLRVTVYVVFLLLQYITKRRSQKEHYGQYLEKMNGLVQQMQ